MTTVVNNPASSNDGGNSMGFLLGAIILVLFGALFFFYGLPYLRGSNQGPQIEVPSTIDVNVNEK